MREAIAVESFFAAKSGEGNSSASTYNPTGAAKVAVETLPVASRVKVTTVISSSWPKFTAACVASVAVGLVANSRFSRSKLNTSPDGLLASRSPSVNNER